MDSIGDDTVYKILGIPFKYPPQSLILWKYSLPCLHCVFENLNGLNERIPGFTWMYLVGVCQKTVSNIPNTLYTQSRLTIEKEGGKTSSFKVRRERVRTECHSSWIPFWRERRKDGWAGEKRDRGGRKR